MGIGRTNWVFETINPINTLTRTQHITFRKKIVMSTISRVVNSSTVQHGHEQPITESTNRLQLHCLPVCVTHGVFDHHRAVPIQRLPQRNRLLALCEFENCAVAGDATKRIIYEVLKLRKIRAFLRF